MNDTMLFNFQGYFYFRINSVTILHILSSVMYPIHLRAEFCYEQNDSVPLLSSASLGVQCTIIFIAFLIPVYF